jgi:hypothetical protein
MKPAVRHALILGGVVIVTFALTLLIARRHPPAGVRRCIVRTGAPHRPRVRRPTDEECLALARGIARGNPALIYASEDSDYALAELFDQLGLYPMPSNGVCRVGGVAPDRPPTMPELFAPPWREPVKLTGVMPATFTRGVRQPGIARVAGLQPESGGGVRAVGGRRWRQPPRAVACPRSRPGAGVFLAVVP